MVILDNENRGSAIEETLEQDNTSRRGKLALFSTPDSSNRGVITVLSLVETATAMLCYGWVAVRYGTLHLTLASVVAPMMLLRTDDSTELALDWWEWWIELMKPSFFRDLIMKIACSKRSVLAFAAPTAVFAAGIWLSLTLFGSTPLRMPEDWQLLWQLAFCLAGFGGSIAYAGLSFRIGATLCILATRPGYVIGNIPQNWRRIVACTDVMHPVEVLPGAAGRFQRFPSLAEALTSPKSKYFPTTDDDEKFLYAVPTFALTGIMRRLASKDFWFRGTADGHSPISRHTVATARALVVTLTIPFYICLVLVISLPAWTYRWSIKGTSILLFPLIFLVQDASRTKPEYFTASITVKGLFAASIAILLVAFSAVSKGLLGVNVMPEEVSSWYTNVVALGHHSHIVEEFFPIRRIPLWQYLVVTCCGVIFFTYLYADRLKTRGTYGPAQQRIFKVVHSVLGVLAVATIFDLVHSSASLARLGEKLD